MSSGLYVFKTEDENSIPFQHRIESILVYKGSYSSQIVIRYKNDFNDYSIVKIRLLNDSIEFDVFFARLEIINNTGQDVTINWRNVNYKGSEGVFYTDANAFKMIKRDIKNTDHS